jgi:hypothetical protein
MLRMVASESPLYGILWRMSIRARRLWWRVRSSLKLLSASPAEWRNLVRAQVALLHARFLLSTRETGRLVSPEEAAPHEGDVSRLVEAKALALAVRRSAVFGLFRPTCLVQSMALMKLLQRDGIPGGRIRIGVRERRGEVQAHAWVEYAGEVIGDFGEHVATFTELTDVRLVGTKPS